MTEKPNCTSCRLSVPPGPQIMRLDVFGALRHVALDREIGFLAIFTAAHFLAYSARIARAFLCIGLFFDLRLVRRLCEFSALPAIKAPKRKQRDERECTHDEEGRREVGGRQMLRRVAVKPCRERHAQ